MYLYRYNNTALQYWKKTLQNVIPKFLFPWLRFSHTHVEGDLFSPWCLSPRYRMLDSVWDTLEDRKWLTTRSRMAAPQHVDSRGTAQSRQVCWHHGGETDHSLFSLRMLNSGHTWCESTAGSGWHHILSYKLDRQTSPASSQHLFPHLHPLHTFPHCSLCGLFGNKRSPVPSLSIIKLLFSLAYMSHVSSSNMKKYRIMFISSSVSVDASSKVSSPRTQTQRQHLNGKVSNHKDVPVGTDIPRWQKCQSPVFSKKQKDTGRLKDVKSAAEQTLKKSSCCAILSVPQLTVLGEMVTMAWVQIKERESEWERGAQPLKRYSLLGVAMVMPLSNRDAQLQGNVLQTLEHAHIHI